MGIGARSYKTRLTGFDQVIETVKIGFSRFDTIPACDSRTDRRTDTAMVKKLLDGSVDRCVTDWDRNEVIVF